jgi:hypothetical protein
MQLSKLSASKSKADFFKHLGWDEENEEHKQLYREMMVRWFLPL